MQFGPNQWRFFLFLRVHWPNLSSVCEKNIISFEISPIPVRFHILDAFYAKMFLFYHWNQSLSFEFVFEQRYIALLTASYDDQLIQMIQFWTLFHRYWSSFMFQTFRDNKFFELRLFFENEATLIQPQPRILQKEKRAGRTKNPAPRRRHQSLGLPPF